MSIHVTYMYVHLEPLRPSIRVRVGVEAYLQIHDHTRFLQREHLLSRRHVDVYTVLRYLLDWDIPHGCVESFVPFLSTNMMIFEERVERSVDLVVHLMPKVHLNILTYENDKEAL